MTEEQATAVLEDDVVTEKDVEALMGDEPTDAPGGEEAPLAFAPVPFRKIVIGVTNEGLVSVEHSDLSILEIAEVARQLAGLASNTMAQQASNYNKAKQNGLV